jgi:hypothetical protein
MRDILVRVLELWRVGNRRMRDDRYNERRNDEENERTYFWGCECACWWLTCFEKSVNNQPSADSKSWLRSSENSEKFQSATGRWQRTAKEAEN